MSRTRRCQMCGAQFTSHDGARICSDECQAQVGSLLPRLELRVICDAEPHPTKVNTIERFVLEAVRPEHAHAVEGAFQSPFGLVRWSGANQWEADDGTYPTATELFGTSTKPPSSDLRPVRSRVRLRCRDPRCGLHVELTREEARRVTVDKLRAGESTVQLSALARMV